MAPLELAHPFNPEWTKGVEEKNTPPLMENVAL